MSVGAVRAVHGHHGETRSFSEPLQQIQPEECIFGCLFKGICVLVFYFAADILNMKTNVDFFSV